MLQKYFNQHKKTVGASVWLKISKYFDLSDLFLSLPPILYLFLTFLDCRVDGRYWKKILANSGTHWTQAQSSIAFFPHAQKWRMKTMFSFHRNSYTPVYNYSLLSQQKSLVHFYFNFNFVALNAEIRKAVHFRR